MWSQRDGSHALWLSKLKKNSYFILHSFDSTKLVTEATRGNGTLFNT